MKQESNANNASDTRNASNASGASNACYTSNHDNQILSININGSQS